MDQPRINNLATFPLRNQPVRYLDTVEVCSSSLHRPTIKSDKQIGPNVEELRQLLRLLFADRSLAAQNLRDTSLGPDDWPQVGWLQRALFEEKNHHVAGLGLLPRRICRRLIVPDQVREEIEERVFLGHHTAFTLLYQSFHNRKSPLVLHFRSDHARRRFRQQAAITLQVDGFGHLPSVVRPEVLAYVVGQAVLPAAAFQAAFSRQAGGFEFPQAPAESRLQPGVAA